MYEKHIKALEARAAGDDVRATDLREACRAAVTLMRAAERVDTAFDHVSVGGMLEDDSDVREALAALMDLNKALYPR